MARDYANRKAKKSGHRSRSNKKNSSWKLWIVAAGLVCLFAAGLYYLNHFDKVTQRKQPTDMSTSQVSDAKKKGPIFEFYTILSSEADTPTSSATVTPVQAVAEPVNTQYNYIIQAGSFRNYADADRLKAQLTLLGYEVNLQSVVQDKINWYRVRIGPYDSLSLAQTIQQQLSHKKINSFVQKTPR